MGTKRKKKKDEEDLRIDATPEELAAAILQQGAPKQ